MARKKDDIDYREDIVDMIKLDFFKNKEKTISRRSSVSFNVNPKKYEHCHNFLSRLTTFFDIESSIMTASSPASVFWFESSLCHIATQRITAIQLKTPSIINFFNNIMSFFFFIILTSQIKK